MDKKILKFLNQYLPSHPTIKRLWVFAARELIFLFGLGFVALLFLMERSEMYPATQLITFAFITFSAFLLNEVISWGIAYVHFRPRPFVDGMRRPLIHMAASMKSFPSDHAVIGFTLTTSLAFLSVPYAIIALVIATLISVGRVVAGVHYPSDILAGALLGILGTLGTFYVMDILFF